MSVNVKNLSEIFNKDVFTAKGDYYGKVIDVKVDLTKFRVRSIVIEAARGSSLANAVGGKRGVIVPYQMIQSIGDVVIVKHIAAPLVGTSKETLPAEDAPSPLPF